MVGHVDNMPNTTTLVLLQYHPTTTITVVVETDINKNKHGMHHPYHHVYCIYTNIIITKNS